MQPRSPQVDLPALADRYLTALLDARRHEATRMILDAIEDGSLNLHELYLGVFEPVLHEVGRRWQHNELSVAEEHYISAATQLVMSQLYPRIFTTDRRGRTMLAACAGTEFHEIGLRMVADFFELDGWDTYYLGANVPTDSILKSLRTRGAKLLALSMTLRDHEPYVREVIRALRDDPALASVRVLVGGSAFRLRPELWREVGADAFSFDAASAVEVANRLVEADAAAGDP